MKEGGRGKRRRVEVVGRRKQKGRKESVVKGEVES